jgi:Pyruvate/2-oxoacid:ferredoxin oxidoreductase gamma subunit
VKLESLIKVIKTRFEGNIGELNADLVRKAYEEAKMG